MPVHAFNGRLQTESDVAEILNVSVRTLQQWRVSGFGPRFIKVGRAVRYRLSDVQDWIDRNIHRSTSDSLT